MLARINRRYVPTYWDDFFNDSFFNDFSMFNSAKGTPAVNVVEENESYKIEMAVPGMSRRDIRIDLEDRVLTISAEQKEHNEEKNRRYLKREFDFHTFRRSFELPETINLEHIKAGHDAGILTIELPKKEEEVQKAPKQIEIK
jgi:HSP20 family protein